MPTTSIPPTISNIPDEESRTLLSEEDPTRNYGTQVPDHDTPNLKNFVDQQSKVLPHKKLMVVFPAIALAQFTSYLDQTSVSTALPAIANDLNIGTSISWVATSFLLASTSIQLVNGRLSDIFGRKVLLISALALLGLGNLISGFAKSPEMMFASRALSGLGGGANALVMIISSDITSLRERGKYNGFIGAFVALGNGLGPLIGGVLTEYASWRWMMWFFVPLVAITIVILAIVLPPSPSTHDGWTKLRMIDWTGLVINILAVLLILTPISEGGANIPWESPIVPGMLGTGMLMSITFLVVEGKFARLPIMPLRLFRNGRSANFLLLGCTIAGFVYWGNLFYISVFLQNVRNFSPVHTGLAILPMVFCHGLGSTISGIIISRTGHYNPVMISSLGLWTIGISIQCFYDRTTPVWIVWVAGLIQGMGIGGCFQPSLVALLAHSKKSDRAVINGLRNFLRAIGGSIGLTVSGTILNNTLYNRLHGLFPPEILKKLTSSTFALPSLNLTPGETEAVLDAYMQALRTIFLMYAPLVAVCFLLQCAVTDNGVAEKDGKLASSENDDRSTDSEESGRANAIRSTDTPASGSHI